MSVPYVLVDQGRRVVTISTPRGKHGRLVEHSALTREEALRTAVGVLTAALDLPVNPSPSGSNEAPS